MHHDVATIIENRRGFWTPRELAELLAVSIKTIYAWVAQDRIPVIRLGSAVRFDPVTTARWLRERAA
jgi:excisionase family DNA binding protein